MRSVCRRWANLCIPWRVSETSTPACTRDDDSVSGESLGTPIGSGSSLLAVGVRRIIRLSKGSVFLGFGGLLLGLVACLIAVLDPYGLILSHTLSLSEGSYAFGLWKKPPVPIYLRVYVFNVTNSDAFLKGEERLRLEEIGPYVYREELENTNPTFGTGDDDSVTFEPRRTVHWENEMSRGSLQDKIIVPNIPLIGLASKLHNSPLWVKMAFTTLTNYLSSKPFLEITVEEYLWGHDEPLLALAAKILPSWVTFSSLGLLDRLFDVGTHNITMNDGRINPKSRYLIQEVNGAPLLGAWSWNEEPDQDETDLNHLHKACEMRDSVVGTYEGVLFPQAIEKNRTLRMYRDAFCRSMVLTYQKEVLTEGQISAFRFQPPLGSFNHTELENACTCVDDEENCLPTGLSDISPCFFSIPLAVSYPHLYQSDPKLREGVIGMLPEKDKHETYLDIQPDIGVPVEAHSRMQLNLVVKDTRRIRRAAPFHDLIIPIVWTDLGLDALPPALLSTVRLLVVTAPIIQKGAIFVLSCLGVAMILACLLFECCLWVEKRNTEEKNKAAIKAWCTKPVINSYQKAKHYVPLTVIQVIDSRNDELQEKLCNESNTEDLNDVRKDCLHDQPLLKKILPLSLQKI